MSSLAEAADQYPQVRQVLEDRTLTSSRAALEINGLGTATSERSVRRWREANGPQESSRPSIPSNLGKPEGECETDPNGATFRKVVVSTPILDDDWGPLLEMFGLNPDNYEVLNDTVRMKSWWVARGSVENDDWQPLQLFSYDARFRKITREPETQEALREVRESLFHPVPLLLQPRIITPYFDCPTTYKFDIADPQIGKKGTVEAVKNWQRGVARHLEAAYELQPTDLHVAYQGDETENVFGHYANQGATVELNQSEQEQLDLELRIWTINQMLALGLPVSVSSVISNHGERRAKTGGDPIQGRGDNNSTKIARMAKMHFDLANADAPISWHIAPDSTPFVVVEHSGVKAYYSHGYVEQGGGPTVEKKLIDAVEKQILGRPEELNDLRLVFVAHYHHAWTNDQRGRTFFGDPALEAKKSSEWVLDRYGQWSHPGMLGMLVGNHTERGYSHANVF